jgi:sugar phosphate isomerase/epimerase
MNCSVDRRRFLKTTGALGAAVAMSSLGARHLPAAEAGAGAPNAKKLGWTLCCSAYSFNQLTFCEAIEKVKALGLDSIEGFNWQELAKDKPGVKTDSAMSAADRKEMRKRLSDAGVRLDVCYLNAMNDEAVSRKSFDWLGDLGVGIVVGEPPLDAYDMIEKLCDEYKINLAIHNHPSPSTYFDPATVAKVCRGRGKRIGSCADTGHWVRSGFDPVEALKLLEGRVLMFHLKDVDSVGNKEAECVPWGTGKGSIAAILKEMRRQKFRGIFSIEYEPYRPENFAKIAECVAFFDRTAAELAG